MIPDPEEVAHHEQIVKLLRERNEAWARIRDMGAHIRWVTQTVHQAHHTDQHGTWRECPKSLCASTRVAIELWGG